MCSLVRLRALGLEPRALGGLEVRTLGSYCRASLIATTAHGAMRDGERYRRACRRGHDRVSCAHAQEHGTLRQAHDCLELALLVRGNYLRGGREPTGGEVTQCQTVGCARGKATVSDFHRQPISRRHGKGGDDVEAQEFQAWMSSSPADQSVEKQLWNVKKFTSSQVKSSRLATVWLPVVSVYNCKLDLTKSRLSYFTSITRCFRFRNFVTESYSL